MAMTIDFYNRKRIESAKQISQYAKDAAFFLECGDVARYENAMLQIHIVLSNLPNIACSGRKSDGESDPTVFRH